MVINYFRFVAEEVREILAGLGVRSLAETHRAHRVPRGRCPGATPPGSASSTSRRSSRTAGAGARGAAVLHHGLATRRSTRASSPSAWWRDMLPAIESQPRRRVALRAEATSTARSARASPGRSRGAGATTAWRDAPLTVRCSGNAGQSFGVWNAGGLHLYLEGDANDYVGKGMAGGRIVLRHPRGARFVAQGDRHHGQYLPVRRHRRRAVRGRRGRRALRGAQLRRAWR